MTMVLPQGSAEAARQVATVLRREGFSCLIRGNDEHGWVVEVLGARDGKEDEPEEGA